MKKLWIYILVPFVFVMIAVYMSRDGVSSIVNGSGEKDSIHITKTKDLNRNNKSNTETETDPRFEFVEDTSTPKKKTLTQRHLVGKARKEYSNYIKFIYSKDGEKAFDSVNGEKFIQLTYRMMPLIRDGGTGNTAKRITEVFEWYNDILQNYRLTKFEIKHLGDIIEGLLKDYKFKVVIFILEELLPIESEGFVKIWYFKQLRISEYYINLQPDSNYKKALLAKVKYLRDLVDKK